MSSFEDNNWLGNMNQNYILNSEQMFDFLKKKLVTHDHTKLYNSVKLSFGQFVFCLCIFCIFMFPFESPPDDNNRVGKEKHICCLHNLKQKIIFGSDRRSRSYNMRSFVRSVQVFRAVNLHLSSSESTKRTLRVIQLEPKILHLVFNK